MIADSLGAGWGQPELGRRGSLNVFEIRGVARGLVAAGALSQEDAEGILADLDVTLARAGWVRTERQEASAVSPGVPVRAGAERAEWRHAIEDPPRPVLRHVVPLVGRTLTIGETTASLVSLEVWTAFLVLNLAYFDVDSRLVRFDPDVRWRGWDDAGTRYHGGSSGASGSHALLVERRTFAPGPAAHARTFTVVVEHPGGRTTVPVALPAE